MASVDISDLLDDDAFEADLDRLAGEHRARRAAGPVIDPRARTVRAELEHVKAHIRTDVNLDALADEWGAAIGQNQASARRGISTRLSLGHWARYLTPGGEPISLDVGDPRVWPRPEASPRQQGFREEVARKLGLENPHARAEETDDSPRAQVSRLVGGI